MKKLLAILMAAALLLGLAACRDKNGEETDEKTTTAANESTTNLGDGNAVLTLVAVRSLQAGAEGIEEYSYAYDDSEGDGPSVQDMADGLDELTGLDFTLQGEAIEGDIITIDWSKDSTLVANLDDRQQKEEFHFFDYDSLAWFMLDSLWQTIIKNMPKMAEQDIYFTMNGGKSLKLPNLSPPMDFTLETPYMGSAFYLAHQDVRGGEGRGDYLPENPEDVSWWGEYRGNAGILRISNFDQNAQGIWHFSFVLVSVDEEDDGVAAIDEDAYAMAEYAKYKFTFSPGETADGDMITINGGTVFDGEYPRFDPDAMG